MPPPLVPRPPRRLRLATAAGPLATVLLAAPASGAGLCPDDTGRPQFDPASHARCEALWPAVRSPSRADGTPKPLDEYEAAVGEFFSRYCYRDPQLTGAGGRPWARDKTVRDTGPYVAFRTAAGEWAAEYHGYHAPVVIWYSPQMMAWLESNRPAGPGAARGASTPVPDGAIIVKEMYTAPAARCAGRDIDHLRPANGIAYMVRDAGASQDGWFWGYFGFFDGADDPNIDWPAPRSDRPLNAPPYAGFGQYCVNCHASAVDNSTFSALANVAGYPGEPLVFLSHDWVLDQVQGDVPEHVPAPAHDAPPIPNSTPLATVPPAFSAIFTLPPDSKPPSVAAITLPSQTYDNVWMKAGSPPPLASEYVTSDQCVGCHDAGSTGLAYDMTVPDPHDGDLVNLSPYATWRSSPMGLAGRDPIFFAQLASEESFHPDYLDTLWNTCFGCHGIMGQRQLQLDGNLAGTPCDDVVFTPDIVTAIPYDGGRPPPPDGPHFDAAKAPYGALARDGISCVACHRTALTPAQTAAFGGQKQNECILARQQALNVELGNLQGFARTFTGSFLVSPPQTLYGPFPDPLTTPMRHALGTKPEHDPAIASSEQCGTCHTVHLPIVWPKKDGKPVYLGDTFEQTTYPEWLFSAYRTGTALVLDGDGTLPGGPGDTPLSCAGCHMESHAEDGTPFRSRIASIQQRSNMPEVENALPAAEIDLPVREGFARHTLVGLNLFLVKMAQQFPDVLGIATQDSNLATEGMPPLERTEREMVASARGKVADVFIAAQRNDGTTLAVDVRVSSKVGHKFPSGVSFRRAFVDFEVLDADGGVLWRSGATDDLGVLIGPGGEPLTGELWYDAQCRKTVTQSDFLPHYQVIDSPAKVQIYQEVKLDPGDPAKVTGLPSCDEGAPVDASANLTTSFLSICHTPKDNRLLPRGLLPVEQRVAIAKRLGLVDDGEARKLAHETGAQGVGDDPDYVTGGGDTVRYRVALAGLARAPAAVRATLYYQATPPFFLQDRFCNGEGSNRDRLFHIAGLLDLDGTPLEGWKFRLVTTGPVAAAPRP